MKKLLLLFSISLLFSCSKNNELNSIVEKNPDLKILVDSLKSTSQIYKKCEECKLSGLEEKKLIGFTDRYPPKGNYDKKEIEIGALKYDAYEILDSKNTKTVNGKLYICYFNQNQKEKFASFENYYRNRIGHYKQLCKVKYVNNTAMISIENMDF